MALASVTCENAALDGIGGGTPANQIPFVSLHTATPGTTGASENAASGGYVRLACTWNAASAGAKTNVTALSFSTLAAVAVTHAGTWTLVSAGVYAIGLVLASAVTAATITVAAGALSLTAT